MTHNQIEYWKLNETKRSNLANEAEAKRANQARELETNRANLENEAIKRRANSINAAHYRNVDAETQRANLAREYENSRSNRANEALKAESNEIERSRVNLGYYQTDANKLVGLTQAAINREVGLANVGAQYASIAELSRANQAREAETTRSNLAHESISRYGNVTNRITAEANRKNASTNAAKQLFSEYQYNDMGRKLQASQVAGNLSQLKSDNYNRAATFNSIITGNANTAINAARTVGSNLNAIKSVGGAILRAWR